jgi:hypothetical protein
VPRRAIVQNTRAACKTFLRGDGNLLVVMSARRQSDGIDDGRGRKMGVAGGRRCVECGVIVHWRVEKFCLSKRDQFRGRIYCIRCQKSIPAPSPAS